MRRSWTGVPLVRAGSGARQQRQPLAHGDVDETGVGARRCLADPVCNRPVFSLDGTLLGYPDLLDVESGTVGEYDGADHKEGERHRKDVEREERYRDHGLEYFTVVGGDIGTGRWCVECRRPAHGPGSRHPIDGVGHWSTRLVGAVKNLSITTCCGSEPPHCSCAADFGDHYQGRTGPCRGPKSRGLKCPGKIGVNCSP